MGDSRKVLNHNVNIAITEDNSRIILHDKSPEGYGLMVKNVIDAVIDAYLPCNICDIFVTYWDMSIIDSFCVNIWFDRKILQLCLAILKYYLYVVVLFIF